MGLIHRLISTCLGIGYMPKGGGTVAAAAACVLWWLLWRGGNGHLWGQAVVTIVMLATGVYSSGRVEPYWGKDSHRVVIDEAAGMFTSFCFVPVRWPYLLAGLVLFRIFDIAKPLYIRRMERLKGGWGVMMDDVLAGVYTNALLQIVVWFNALL
ncbi:MAG TPA: phosphatidylglycerophosphatase A [Puia sp.]|nr:phosphatidylglycerophosphatase A [Puia sp.]